METSKPAQPAPGAVSRPRVLLKEGNCCQTADCRCGKQLRKRRSSLSLTSPVGVCKPWLTPSLLASGPLLLLVLLVLLGGSLLAWTPGGRQRLVSSITGRTGSISFSSPSAGGAEGGSLEPGQVAGGSGDTAGGGTAAETEDSPGGQTGPPKGRQKGMHRGKKNSASLVEAPIIESELPPFSPSCDLSVGQWVHDDSYPLYGASCIYADYPTRCLISGRVDTDYVKWRWQPSGCKVPRFDPQSLLARLRHKRVAFIGDSLNRNMWESSMCMLHEGLPEGARFVDPLGGEVTKTTLFHQFHEDTHNVSMEYYRAVFIAHMSDPPEDKSLNPTGAAGVLKLDEAAPVWAERARGADVLVFNSGHWWNSDKLSTKNCLYMHKGVPKPDLSVDEAYHLMVDMIVQWVRDHVDLTRTKVFFRGFSPVHFENGTWKNGGDCARTQPLPFWETQRLLRRAGNLWKERAISRLAVSEQPWHFLDVMPLSMARADGHLRFYGAQNWTMDPPKIKDCSHWCLPGVPDTWNELMFLTLLQDEMAEAEKVSS